MSDFRIDESRKESPLADSIDLAARRIMAALVIAGGAIALAIYSRPEPPRYEVDVMGSTVLRTDTRRGGVLACEGQRCYVLIRRGPQRGEAPPEEAPQPQKALPAAQPTPADTNVQ
jgi:hypothetical protein